jgi:hypothetical protein
LAKKKKKNGVHYQQAAFFFFLPLRFGSSIVCSGFPCPFPLFLNYLSFDFWLAHITANLSARARVHCLSNIKIPFMKGKRIRNKRNKNPPSLQRHAEAQTSIFALLLRQRRHCAQRNPLKGLSNQSP